MTEKELTSNADDVIEKNDSISELQIDPDTPEELIASLKAEIEGLKKIRNKRKASRECSGRRGSSYRGNCRI